MSDWIMIKTPYVSKRTGTAVREFGLKDNRDVTMRQVSPGPGAKRAKYSRIEVIRNKGELISIKADDISLGMHQECNIVKKNKGGWKRIFSVFRAL